MKKSIIVLCYIFSILIMLFLAGCPNVNHTQETSLKISLANLNELINRNQLTNRIAADEINSILISIKKASGAYIYTLEKFNIYPMGTMYISDPINFSGQSGDYSVTDFLVLNREERVIYAAPKAGSEKAESVSNPLPCTFTVANGQSITVPIEVVEIDASMDPLQFGYVTLGFTIAEPLIGAGLITEYLFAGNGNDSSGNNNPAILTGTGYTADRFNNPAQALKLQNSSSRIQFTRALSSNRFSVSLWYYYNNTDGDSISLLGDITESYHQILINQANRQIGFYNDGWYSSGVTLTTGNWYHIALVRENSLSKLYLNGSLIQESLVGVNNSDYPAAQLGFILNPQTNNNTDSIDDVKVYGRKLSGNEVALLYADQAPQVNITYPADASTVSGQVTVTAAAADDTNLVKVEFYIDNVLAATDAAAPYGFVWNTEQTGNNAHTLTAKAYDTIGQVLIDNDTTVIVNNALYTTRISIAAGNNFTVAVKADGTVRSWGYNNTYQLGDGTSVTYSTLPVTVNGLTNVIAVASGNSHTLVLRNDHTVWSWGYNGYGELGDGSAINKAVPVKVSNLTNIAAIACGSEHSLALKSDGTVWGFGQNNNGELGLGTITTNELLPVQIPGLTNIIAVSCGADYSMVLKDDGTVWATGYNNYGQLGDGTATQRTVFTQVTGMSNVIAISCGYYHSHAVKNDGTVWSWGYNGNGELGNATQTTIYTPVKVNGLSGVISIASGNNHTLALKKDGSVWAWGYNYYGELGDGTTIVKTVPVKITNLSGIVYIAASRYYHCAAVKADGTVYTWGYNGYGGLGNGNTTNQSLPVQVSGLTGVAAPAVTFDPIVPYTPPQTNKILDAGTFHSLTINTADPDKRVWAWGYNGNGQLGDGSTTDKLSPVQVNGLEDVISIAGGSMHSVALKSDGTVYAWGLNNYGQIGDGTTVNKPNFVKVNPLSNIVAIAAGGQYNGSSYGYVGHTLALQNDGTVWAWGYNTYGQLGDCTYSYKTSPVKVNGLDHVKKIACGSLTSYALKDDGTVWSWGYNGQGQLGDNTTLDKPVPVKMETLSGITDIAGGLLYALFLKNDGTVYACGYNGYGQLGDATTTSRALPVAVNGLTGVVKIASGPCHAFAVRNDGSLWGWGYNGYGNLGDNTTVSKLTPALIPGISQVVEIAASQGYETSTIYSHSLAITNDGKIRGWGYNGHGELGDGSATTKYIPTMVNIPWL